MLPDVLRFDWDAIAKDGDTRNQFVVKHFESSRSVHGHVWEVAKEHPCAIQAES